MKKLFLMLAIYSGILSAQEFPNVALENLQGETFATGNFNEINNKPIVISFWATWCIPCLNELSLVNEKIADWKKQYQFEFYGISVDDDRTVKKVASLVNGKNWDFDILLDTNQDLKRKLNINTIPYLIVIKNGKIIHKKTGFVKGEENDIEKIIANNQ